MEGKFEYRQIKSEFEIDLLDNFLLHPHMTDRLKQTMLPFGSKSSVKSSSRQTTAAPRPDRMGNDTSVTTPGVTSGNVTAAELEAIRKMEKNSRPPRPFNGNEQESSNRELQLRLHSFNLYAIRMYTYNIYYNNTQQI